MSLFEADSIASVLTEEFSSRKKKNSSYSLRAFARDLKLSPSRLSEVMSRKQGLSEESIDTIAKRISQKRKERLFLKDLVLVEFGRGPEVRRLAKKRIELVRKEESFQRLKEDQFRVICDWYHSAILEVMALEDFKSDVRWIANRIGIHVSLAEQALLRLETVGLIVKNTKGIWKAKPHAYSTFSDTPSSAFKKFHMQLMQMHTVSLREDPISEREFYSMIMAFPRNRLPEFREELRSFLTQFWKKYEEDPKDEIYSLGFQFCPVKNRASK